MTDTAANPVKFVVVRRLANPNRRTAGLFSSLFSGSEKANGLRAKPSRLSLMFPQIVTCLCVFAGGGRPGRGHLFQDYRFVTQPRYDPHTIHPLFAGFIVLRLAASSAEGNLPTTISFTKRIALNEMSPIKELRGRGVARNLFFWGV